MKESFDVEICMEDSATEVLSKITASTAREIITFVSATTYPTQKEKGFVAKISGNRIRIWKVPSSSRSARQKLCIPYLRGQANDSDGGCKLLGSFSLHPFNKLMIFFPAVAVLMPGWLSGSKNLGFLIFWSLLTVCFVFFGLTIIREVIRLRPKEEKDIIEFLMSLFPNAQLSRVGRVRT